MNYIEFISDLAQWIAILFLVSYAQKHEEHLFPKEKKRTQMRVSFIKSTVRPLSKADWIMVRIIYLAFLIIFLFYL